MMSFTYTHRHETQSGLVSHPQSTDPTTYAVDINWSLLCFSSFQMSFYRK